MRNLPVEALRSGIRKTVTHAPAANLTAFGELLADADEFWVIDEIWAGYDSAPTTSPLLYIQYTVDGSLDARELPPIRRAGMFRFRFPRGYYSYGKNVKASIILEAGGAGVKGTVTIAYC